jgi:hypothetical protein
VGDEKNHLGDKLHKKEKVEEDGFIREREAAALARLRQQKEARQADQARAQVLGRCPKCGEPLAAVEHYGVTVKECPGCHGMWVDQGELETLASRERDSWLGRFFYRPRR